MRITQFDLCVCVCVRVLCVNECVRVANIGNGSPLIYHLNTWFENTLYSYRSMHKFCYFLLYLCTFYTMSEQKQQQQHVNKKKTRERAQAFANAAQTQLTLKWITDDALINQTISVGLSGSNDKMNITTAEQFHFREREKTRKRERKKIEYNIWSRKHKLSSIQYFPRKYKHPNICHRSN